ncbi:MAG: 50S ribosomal protein L3 [Bdellovibrionales bacterium CG10_big_fil_rev_8_21_14_0_10_45_34]|nr:MAG: 50S ribosomal protein L3 [Bdellovibrionales bacterium CG10_big_fil_rev_8_21_14_0_10_45_34]
MSEQNEEVTTDSDPTGAAESAGLKLPGLFATKVGMTTVYTENGDSVPVTVLKVGDWRVTQVIKSADRGYSAIQIGSGIKKAKNASKAETKAFGAAGFESGAQKVGEIRVESDLEASVGQAVDIHSFTKGDKVKVTGKSKGCGFSGVVKRYKFAGGPASHGSHFHRQPGSSGNRTWPGRVLPGKRFPGQYGNKNITVRGLKVIEILPEESVILVKGSVPGAMNTLLRVEKI